MAIADYDWEGFRGLARRLDTLLAGEAELGEEETFAEACRRLLAFLYAAGVTMPTAGDVYEDSGGDEFWETAISLDREGGIDTATTDAEIAEIANALRADIEELQEDVDAEDYEELLGVAALNLHSVRESLGDGMTHFDAKRINEAAWDWSFGFDEWGDRALVAMSALHELLWGAS